MIVEININYSDEEMRRTLQKIESAFYKKHNYNCVNDNPKIKKISHTANMLLLSYKFNNINAFECIRRFKNFLQLQEKEQ